MEQGDAPLHGTTQHVDMRLDSIAYMLLKNMFMVRCVMAPPRGKIGVSCVSRVAMGPSWQVSFAGPVPYFVLFLRRMALPAARWGRGSQGQTDGY